MESPSGNPTAGAAVWDPAQYERFKAERAQPFLDLIARIPERPVRTAADLGCGTGELTRLLLAKWPEAKIWGVDRSANMLQRARAADTDPRLDFTVAELQRWRPPGPLDCIVSNAALQWVPDHGRLLADLAAMLSSTGVLAVQVPNNRSEKAYDLFEELAAEAPWADRLKDCEPQPAVETAGWYGERLCELGLAASVWETIYYHRMPGGAAIVEWMKGTTLRPVLSVLGETQADEFLASLTFRVAKAYTAGPFGVVFPFRRLFFIASRGSKANG